jgi:choline dehydrogenase
MVARRTGLVVFLIALAVGLGIWAIVETAKGPGSGPRDDGTFDYVIVGGGAAGCVMAERLSRSGKHTVLLIETGPDVDNDVPIKTVNLQSVFLPQTNFNEYFWAVVKDAPGAQAPPAETGNDFYTTGRVLGGGSSINGMQFVRGTDWMRQLWVNLTGDNIWDVENAQRHWQELETYRSVDGNYTQRGNRGRLSVLEEMITPPQTTPTTMSLKLVQALTQLTGLPALVDYNALTPASELGPFARWQLTAYPDGTRSSSSRAFLSPDVVARPNLQITLHSTAMRLHAVAATQRDFGGAGGSGAGWEGGGGGGGDNKPPRMRVNQVTYVRNGVEHKAYAARRMILCAGVYSTTLLQLSGIGNASYLASLGIEPLVDNPNVGARLYNQQGAFVIFVKNASDVPSANPADVYEGGAFLPTALNASQGDSTGKSPRRYQLIGINGGATMELAIFDLQPNVSGFVRIRDRDPLRAPEVSDATFLPPYGTVDLLNFAAAIQLYACDLNGVFAGTGPGPAVDTSYILVDPPQSICGNQTALVAWVQANAVTSAHHWTGQNVMGHFGDGVSVVNGHGTVYGVDGLTVADGSIIPAADGNTQAPSYLVAWTLADEILRDRFY